MQTETFKMLGGNARYQEASVSYPHRRVLWLIVDRSAATRDQERTLTIYSS